MLSRGLLRTVEPHVHGSKTSRQGAEGTKPTLCSAHRAVCPGFALPPSGGKGLGLLRKGLVRWPDWPPPPCRGVTFSSSHRATLWLVAPCWDPQPDP